MSIDIFVPFKKAVRFFPHLSLPSLNIHDATHPQHGATLAMTVSTTAPWPDILRREATSSIRLRYKLPRKTLTIKFSQDFRKL